MKRGAGQTEALKLEIIAKAIRAAGSTVQFHDHYPHTFVSARSHAMAIETMIKQLKLSHIHCRVIGCAVLVRSDFTGSPYPDHVSEKSCRCNHEKHERGER